MDIPLLIGQSIGSALVTGTFLFYMIKGFINRKAKWPIVIIGAFTVFLPLFYISYPQSPLDNPLLKLLNGILFFGGVAGAIKYYRRPKSSTTEANIQK